MLNSKIGFIQFVRGGKIFRSMSSVLFTLLMMFALPGNQSCATAGIISTVAGTGTSGYSGDGGAAVSAKVNRPNGNFVDNAGNIYVADTNNNRIRKIDPNGIITTVAGTGSMGYSGDGGTATSAALAGPSGVFVDNGGNIFIADSVNNRIRKVIPNGTISTVAGKGTQGNSGDGGPATSAQLSNPTSVSVDGAGNIYIADSNNQRVRKVATNGTITTVVSRGPEGYSIGTLTGIFVDAAGDIYIADNLSSILKVPVGGSIVRVAGKRATQGYSGDGGLATSAELFQPYGVFVDSAGIIFIADSGNNRIRKVGTDGTISTIAGNGNLAYSGDGGPGTAAGIKGPLGVSADTEGNIYIVDTNNNRIRKVLSDTSAPVFTITPSAGANGSISPNVAQAVNYGATKQFTVTPNTGYSAIVSGCGGIISSSSTAISYITGTVTGNCTVVANFAATAVNGTCGAVNGSTLSSKPTVNLCGDASMPQVTGSGPWNWTCAGTNGGTTATCSASKQAITKPGDCDGDSTVTIAEVALAYNMFLGIRFLEGCVDLDANNVVSITEVQKTINGFLDIPIGSIDSQGPTAQILLGSATGVAGGQVSIPISLASNGASIASFSVDIGYDPNKLSVPTNASGTAPLAATRGPAITVTDENGDPIKNIVQSMPTPGVLRLGISGNNTLAIGDGVVTYVKINISESATGESVLTNSVVAASPAATNVPVTAVNGIITANIGLVPVNGTCGSSNVQTFATAPTTNLCSYTSITPTVTNDSGFWFWTCSGSNGGAHMICSANMPAINSKPGDCNGNGTVTIDEVQRAINMFLGSKAPEACVDTDGVGGVTISEVQKVINSFLGL